MVIRTAMRFFNRILPLFKETFACWQADQVPRLAAALTCYTLFSLAPLVIITIAIAGFFFNKEAASGAVAAQIETVFGSKSAQAIQTIIKNASDASSSFGASVIGVATLLFGSAGVFGELQNALNLIWGVEGRSGRGFLSLIQQRFLSFTMVLGTGFLLLVSLVLSTVVAALGKFVGGQIAWLSGLGQVLEGVLSFGLFILLLAMIYKMLPETKISWADVWIAAGMSALLFTAGKTLLGLYLGRSSLTSVYGAAGSLVALLVWVYYSAHILFFGAKFAKVYTKKYGSHAEPEGHDGGGSGSPPPMKG